MENISTEEVFKLIENYLFAFSSREKAIKEIFPDGFKSYQQLKKDELEKVINNNLLTYFHNEFKNKKLPAIIKKYINKNGIRGLLTKQDISFLDNLIIESRYELSFEDLTKLYELPIIKNSISKKDNSNFIQQLREYEEALEMSEEEDIPYASTISDYHSSDNYAIYKNDIAAYKVLTPEQEKEYFKKYKETKDEDAREMLINCNQGLVLKMARAYSGRGLELLDLIQEGNIGLMKAIERFDPDKGFKFSTYAIWWLRQSIKRAVQDQSTTIRIPVHMQEQQEKLNRIEKEYMIKYGVEPTMKQLMELSGFTKQMIEDTKAHQLQAISFNKPVSTAEGGDDSELGDFLKSDIESPEDLADREAEHEVYEQALQKLGQDPKEKDPMRLEQVMRLRKGYEWYNDLTHELIKQAGLPMKIKEYTLEEVGTVFGVTRERIRQIEAKAVRKLKVLLASYKQELDGPTKQKWYN